MKNKFTKVLKLTRKETFNFSLEQISKDFYEMGLILLGAFLGTLISISLSKDGNSFKIWLILIIFFLVLYIILNFLKNIQKVYK